MNASTRDATADRHWPILVLDPPTYCTAHGRTLPCSDCRPPAVSPFVRRALAGILPAVEYTNGRRS